MSAGEEDIPPIEWHPTELFSRQDGSRCSKDSLTIIILNQPLNDFQTLKRLWHNSSLHIAADGGANRLHELNQRVVKNTGTGTDSVDSSDVLNDLHVIIGDLDSLEQTTRSYYEGVSPGVQVIHDPDQYSTDFTKAVRYIRAHKPGSEIVCMGGLGGRVDQGLSQLHHLYMFQTSPAYEEGRMYLVSGESLTFLLKRGRHAIRVRPARRRDRDDAGRNGGDDEVFGRHVGIIPVKEPSVLSTQGLEWDVRDWKTEFGGQISTSNHVLPETEVVEVMTSSDVLFTIALRR